MLCVYACPKDAINSTGGSARSGWGCEGVGGDIPSAIDEKALQKEGVMNANRKTPAGLSRPSPSPSPPPFALQVWTCCSRQ